MSSQSRPCENSSRSREAEEVLYPLAKPRSESLAGLVSIGKLFQPRFSDCHPPREDLAELGGDRGPILEDRREIDLGDFVDRRLGQRPDGEHGRGAGQQPGLSKAVARGKAHRFLFSCPAALNGDQDAGAQDEESLSDAALLDEHIAGPVGSPLHLWREMDALVLRKRGEDRKVIEQAPRHICSFWPRDARRKRRGAPDGGARRMPADLKCRNTRSKSSVCASGPWSMFETKN